MEYQFIWVLCVLSRVSGIADVAMRALLLETLQREYRWVIDDE